MEKLSYGSMTCFHSLMWVTTPDNMGAASKALRALSQSIFCMLLLTEPHLCF